MQAGSDAQTGGAVARVGQRMASSAPKPVLDRLGLAFVQVMVGRQGGGDAIPHGRSQLTG